MDPVPARKRMSPVTIVRHLALVPLWGCRNSPRVDLATALFWSGGALDPHLACVPAGIEFVVTQLKSMVLTLGLMDLHLTVEQAVLLSRLEEEYQVRCSQQPKGRGWNGVR